MSELNTSFSVANAMAETAINFVETNNEIYVGEMEYSRQLNLEAKTEALEAADLDRDAAVQHQTAGMLNAGAQMGGGVVSLKGAQSMKSTDPMVDGSPEFKNSVEQLDQKTQQLTTKRNDLGNTKTASDANKTFADVNETDVQGWRDRSSELETQLNDPNANLTVTERQNLTQEKANLDQDIETYTEYEQTGVELNQNIFNRDQMVANEAQRLAGITRMTYEGSAQVVEGAVRMVATEFQCEGDMQGIEASEKRTEHDWLSSQASSMQSLANSANQHAEGGISSFNQVNQQEGELVRQLSAYH